MTKPSSSEAETKTLLIAIGGPTCSGKTSLVKHIQSVLPDGDSFIIHQDDFAPVSLYTHLVVQERRENGISWLICVFFPKMLIGG